MDKKTRKRQRGQALVEYMFIFLLSVTFMYKTVGLFSEYLRDSMSNLGHVMSLNMMTGVCPEDCWFDGYQNTYKAK